MVRVLVRNLCKVPLGSFRIVPRARVWAHGALIILVPVHLVKAAWEMDAGYDLQQDRNI